MKKVVVKLEINGGKEKQKVMKAVSSLKGVESLALDMKEKKLTVLGDIDPVDIVRKLRRSLRPEIVNVGPARESDRKKESENKSERDENKGMNMMQHGAQFHKPPSDYYYYYPQNYPVYRYEDDPRSCTIM